MNDPQASHQGLTLVFAFLLPSMAHRIELGATAVKRLEKGRVYTRGLHSRPMPIEFESID